MHVPTHEHYTPHAHIHTYHASAHMHTYHAHVHMHTYHAHVHMHTCARTYTILYYASNLYLIKVPRGAEGGIQGHMARDISLLQRLLVSMALHGCTVEPT